MEMNRQEPLGTFEVEIFYILLGVWGTWVYTAVPTLTGHELDHDLQENRKGGGLA